jgi:GDPmannose 4,6-dehydratase
MKTAIVTGVAGQDGYYLSRLLLSKGYRVVGWARRNSKTSHLEGVEIEPVDICDSYHVAREIERVRPDEIYNLAAQSHVGQSFKSPAYTCQVNYTGYLNVLLAARGSKCKIYQAGTSEMFGYAADTICNEQTPFAPMSPYAISKVASHWAGVNARFEANQFVCNGILFNHESPMRGEDFVTRKVTQFVANWAKTKEGVLKLGNLDSSRDWGFAGDYVEAMHLMMQRDFPDDYVIATGESHTIKALLEVAFSAISETIEIIGNEGFVKGVKVLEVTPSEYRPNDLKYLKGAASKARNLLKWEPKKGFRQMIYEMVHEDLK